MGIGYEEAIDKRNPDEHGFQVDNGPTGFPRADDVTFRRVLVDVEKAGNVAVVPKFVKVEIHLYAYWVSRLEYVSPAVEKANSCFLVSTLIFYCSGSTGEPLCMQ
ncbi:hypothetical protein MPTK1_8g08040 [Marchantia polymorpha subsp. ruderalis]|nr:hypothetical protein MARPO_0155s0013 [Marchantia polymorpha]BBN19119.1 hypothetical protein Mp_8g08040 [Marchantia polymorpha subsp. ruderalis]|eukprot:PTQ28751.1 hypothetical protein MARPO_0155s0013 [Marchantia polymorpha]